MFKSAIRRLADVLSVLLVYGLRLFDNFGKCDVLSVRPSQYSYVYIYIYVHIHVMNSHIYRHACTTNMIMTKEHISNINMCFDNK